LALPSRRRQRHSTYTHYTRDCGILGGRGSAGQAASQDKGEKQTNRQIKILKSVGQSQTGVIFVGCSLKVSTPLTLERIFIFRGSILHREILGA